MNDTQTLKLEHVSITSPFWKRYRDLIATKSVPFQWDMINDQGTMDVVNTGIAGGAAEKSGAIENLKIAAGRIKGHHFGYPFQDTDVYKWLETAAYVLNYHPDDQLRKEADSVVDLIADAQDDDGYLSTYFQIDAPERKFKRLQQSHELYSMGHYIEAGVAYYVSVGSQKALDIAKKMADCIDAHFGPQDGKIHGYDGHPEIELALAKLYEVTREQRYLDLAKYLITFRGKDPDFFIRQDKADGWEKDFFPELREIGNRYYFADKPVTEQSDAHGHAVRVLYFCTGLAHVAELTDDKELLDAAHRLFDDIVHRQMYVTGNVGQTTTGEAFTYDYDLPNDTDYGETCASCAMTFFTNEMLKDDFKGVYGDVIEKEIFNGALSGIALDGKHYFYVNPMEVDPRASKLDPGKGHIATRRSSWFACACCPANITRLIASLDKYLYSVQGDTILSHQFVANKATFGNGIAIDQESNFPWDGEISYSIDNPQSEHFVFGVRIPQWSAESYQLTLNGKAAKVDLKDGIAYFEITEPHTELALSLNMQARLVHTNPKVKDNINKVAVQRGPIVYCAEGVDNQGDLWRYRLPDKPSFSYAYRDDLLEGVGTLTTDAAERLGDASSDDLYSFDGPSQVKTAQLRLIPYYSWANRDEAEMSVWLNR